MVAKEIFEQIEEEEEMKEKKILLISEEKNHMWYKKMGHIEII